MIPITNIEFLEALFADLPDDAAALVCGFPGDPNDETGDRRWKWAARPWCHGKALPANIGADVNTYVVVSSFCRDSAGKYRRRKDQFKRQNAVMIDDVGTKVVPTRLRLAPSARLETSPLNFQDYLFIETTAAADDPAITARLLEQLVAKGLATGGVDPGMKGVTRYGRLPVGINGKAKYVQALGSPFRTRVVEWAPERRYTIEQIASAYAIDLADPQPRVFAPLSADLAEMRITQFDLMMQAIGEAGLYLSTRPNGAWHDVICPWSEDHSDGSITGTAISVPSAANNWAGGFKCHHGHCEQRTIKNVYHFAREFRKALKGSSA